MMESYTFPKEIDFPRYNTKCSGENETLRGIFRVVFGFPLHFMLYLGGLLFGQCRTTGGDAAPPICGLETTPPTRGQYTYSEGEEPAILPHPHS